MTTRAINSSLRNLLLSIGAAIVAALVLWRAPWVFSDAYHRLALLWDVLLDLSVQGGPAQVAIIATAVVLDVTIIMLFGWLLVMRGWARAIFRPLPLLLLAASYYVFASLIFTLDMNADSEYLQWAVTTATAVAGWIWPLWRFCTIPFLDLGVLSMDDVVELYKMMSPMVAYLTAFAFCTLLSCVIDGRLGMSEVSSGGTGMAWRALRNAQATARAYDKAVPRRIHFYCTDSFGKDNAAALDERHIAIGPYLVSDLSLPQSDMRYRKAMAVVLHEMGHVANKDVMAQRMCYTTMLIYSQTVVVIYYLVRLLVIALSVLPYVGSLARPLLMLMNWLQYLVRLAMAWLYRLFTVIGGKYHESQADAFAARCGYGLYMIGFLEDCRSKYGEGSLFDEHPRTSARIEALKRIIASMEAQAGKRGGKPMPKVPKPEELSANGRPYDRERYILRGTKSKSKVQDGQTRQDSASASSKEQSSAKTSPRPAADASASYKDAPTQQSKAPQDARQPAPGPTQKPASQSSAGANPKPSSASEQKPTPRPAQQAASAQGPAPGPAQKPASAASASAAPASDSGTTPTASAGAPRPAAEPYVQPRPASETTQSPGQGSVATISNTEAFALARDAGRLKELLYDPESTLTREDLLAVIACVPTGASLVDSAFWKVMPLLYPKILKLLGLLDFAKWEASSDISVQYAKGYFDIIRSFIKNDDVLVLDLVFYIVKCTWVYNKKDKIQEHMIQSYCSMLPELVPLETEKAFLCRLPTLLPIYEVTDAWMTEYLRCHYPTYERGSKTMQRKVMRWMYEFVKPLIGVEMEQTLADGQKRDFCAVYMPRMQEYLDSLHPAYVPSLVQDYECFCEGYNLAIVDADAAQRIFKVISELKTDKYDSLWGIAQ